MGFGGIDVTKPCELIGSGGFSFANTGITVGNLVRALPQVDAGSLSFSFASCGFWSFSLGSRAAFVRVCVLMAVCFSRQRPVLIIDCGPDEDQGKIDGPGSGGNRPREVAGTRGNHEKQAKPS